MANETVTRDHVELKYPDVSLMFVMHAGPGITSSHSVFIKDARRNGFSKDGYTAPGTLLDVISRQSEPGDGTKSFATKFDFDSFIKENPKAAPILVSIGEKGKSTRVVNELRRLNVAELRELVRGYFSEFSLNINDTRNVSMVMRGHKKAFIEALGDKKYGAISPDVAEGLHAILTHQLYGRLDQVLDPKGPGHARLITGLDDVVDGFHRATILSGDRQKPRSGIGDHISEGAEWLANKIGNKRDDARVARNAATRLAYESMEMAGIAEAFLDGKLSRTDIAASRNAAQDARGLAGLRARVQAGVSSGKPTHFRMELSQAEIEAIEAACANKKITTGNDSYEHSAKRFLLKELIKETGFNDEKTLGVNASKDAVLRDNFTSEHALSPRQWLALWEEAILRFAGGNDKPVSGQRLDRVRALITDTAKQVMSDKATQAKKDGKADEIAPNMRVDFKAAVEKCGLTLDALDSYFKFPAGTMSDIQRELTNFADPKNKHLVEEWRSKPKATDAVAAPKPGEKATPATSIQAAQLQRVQERLDGLYL